LSAPQFRCPREVAGPRLRFRDARPRDAEFILALRLDPRRGAHLSRTDPDLAAQRRWLETYADDRSQVYFIIEDERRRAVGTVRLYDARGPSFCWGSWILSDQAPGSSAVESTLMVYAFALACGFTRAHFDVRRGNEKVWQYHERFGARRVDEDVLDYHFEMEEPQIRAALEQYRDRIPDGVAIAWE
jgi:RimJ/RimL family protein N-acetyltransferase